MFDLAVPSPSLTPARRTKNLRTLAQPWLLAAELRHCQIPASQGAVFAGFTYVVIARYSNPQASVPPIVPRTPPTDLGRFVHMSVWIGGLDF